MTDKKRRVYEVVVILTKKQLKYLYKTYPKEWRFERKLIEWYVGENVKHMDNEGEPVEDLMDDGTDLYKIPKEGHGRFERLLHPLEPRGLKKLKL